MVPPTLPHPYVTLNQVIQAGSGIQELIDMWPGFSR